MGKNRYILTSLLLVLCLVLTACGKGQEPLTGEPSHSLRINAMIGDVQDTLDPAHADADGSETVLYHLFENLMSWEDDGTGHAILVPGQAESYTVETDFAGNATYTFTLRKDIYWSDGEPVTAQDFVNTWRRLADPATNSPYSSLLSPVAGYDTVQELQDPAYLQIGARGDSTIIIHLTGSCAYFLEEVCASAHTMPLRCTVTEAELPSEGEDTSVRTAALIEPLGNLQTGKGVPTNGRYVLGSMEKGTLTLDRSVSYWGRTAAGPDVITLLPFSGSPEENYQKLLNGELDLVARLPEDALAEQQESSENWLPEPGDSVYAVVFNTTAAPFDDPDVRLAFRLAVDTTAIAEATEDLTVRPAFGLIPYGITDYGKRTPDKAEAVAMDAPPALPDPDGEPEEEPDAPWDFRAHSQELVTIPHEIDYDADCSTARSLMAKAGFTGGQSFPHVTYTYPDTPKAKAVALALQSMWKEQLGVTVAIEAVNPLEYAPSLDSEVSGDGSSQPFQLTSMLFTAAYDDAGALLDLWYSESPDNPAGYASSAYDILLRSARDAVSPEARDAYLHDNEAILMTDAPVIPLCYPGWSYRLSPAYQGLCRRTDSVLFLWALTPVSQ